MQRKESNSSRSSAQSRLIIYRTAMERSVRIVQRRLQKIMRISWSSLTCRALLARGLNGHQKHLPSRKRRKASSSYPATEVQPTVLFQGIKDALPSPQSASVRAKARARGTFWTVNLGTQKVNSPKHWLS